MKYATGGIVSSTTGLIEGHHEAQKANAKRKISSPLIWPDDSRRARGVEPYQAAAFCWRLHVHTGGIAMSEVITLTPVIVQRQREAILVDIAKEAIFFHTVAMSEAKTRADYVLHDLSLGLGAMKRHIGLYAATIDGLSEGWI